jgi:hypothetical protein
MQYIYNRRVSSYGFYPVKNGKMKLQYIHVNQQNHFAGYKHKVSFAQRSEFRIVSYNGLECFLVGLKGHLHEIIYLCFFI